MIGIYIICCKENNKVYIGQAVDIRRRWRQHKYELNSNTKTNDHLQKAWNKYGADNFKFSILCECDKNKLDELEQYYIYCYESYDRKFGYNNNYGGSGVRGYKLTEEHKRKISKALKGEKHPFYGIHLSENHKKNMSKNNAKYWNGKHRSEETKGKISKSNKGKPSWIKGKHMSKEYKEKIGNANGKAVYCIELNKVFYGACEAGRELGIPNSNISACCLGKLKSAGGYHWAYSEGLTSEKIEKIKEEIFKNKVLCIEKDKIFNSVEEAGYELKINVSGIYSCCSGNRKSAGGYHWIYLKDATIEEIEKKKTLKIKEYKNKVHCIELDKTFDSITEARDSLKISGSSISAVCKGKRKTAGGYHWKYL